MKARPYLLTIIIMVSLWLNLQNVSGNSVFQKNDTLVYIHNVKVDDTEDIAIERERTTMNDYRLSAKIDTTQDDFIFISARTFASGLNTGISNYRSIASYRPVNKGLDHPKNVYYIDPEGDRVRI